MLRVNTTGRHVTTAAWALGPERTCAWKDLNLWVVDRGRGRVETPTGTIDLHTGQALVLRGGTAYRFHNDRHRRIEHFFVHFDCLDAHGQPIAPDRATSLPLHSRLNTYAFVSQMLTRLVEAWRSNADATVWLAAILREIEVQGALAHRHPTADHGQTAVRQLCDAIRRQPEQPWTVQAMAEQFGYSSTHLARLFRQHAGQSPKQVVLDARLEAARHLLLDSDLPIGTIAEQLGYTNVFFFSRQFRQHHGMSPTMFRKGDCTFT